MSNYEVIAGRKARKYGLNPTYFKNQIGAESNFDPNASSPAGALGIAQITPDTARAWGVDPRRPRQALDAAAKHMAQYVDQYGGIENALRAYNAGPGAIEASRGYAETNAYVNKILGGSRPNTPVARTATPKPHENPVSKLIDVFSKMNEATQPTSSPISTFTQNPGSDLLANLQKSTADIQAKNMDIMKSMFGRGAKSDGSGGVANINQGFDLGPTGGGGHGAVSWASGRVGQFKENQGANRGNQLDQLQNRFGMTGQPWCAMFATTAASQGGASKGVRTASVAQINDWASKGVNGYERGLRHGSQARPGDLMTFGNDHVGLVERVDRRRGVIYTIEGNTSSGAVQQVERPMNSGMIARPKYRGN